MNPSGTKEWIDFMFNEENSHKCESCPANEGHSSWPGFRLPCGQFNCWVDVHTDRGN